MDNYSTHGHPKVRAWFAKRPRYHLHFTPTYASWLNQVERWFALIRPSQSAGKSRCATEIALRYFCLGGMPPDPAKSH